MDKLVVFSLLFPIIMGVVVFQYRKELLYLVKTKLIKVEENYDLVVIIPSARTNFIQRQAIRDTWWQYVRNNDTLKERVMLKFVVGSKSCDYPPEDRLSEYGCEPWIPHNVPEVDLYAVKEYVTEASPLYDRNYGIQYLPFQVDHPVLLGRLGLHQHSLVDGATVSLLDAISQKEIVSATFSLEDRGSLIDGYYYKPVQGYLLPKGFEGSIVAENPQHSTGKLPCTTNTIYSVLQNTSALHFIQFTEPVESHYLDPYVWEANRLMLISFIYNIHDTELLESRIQGRSDRISSVAKAQIITNEKLQEEKEKYEDILFVDVMDIYRNIPLKLLEAFKWLSSEMVNLKMVLKTDDDVFIDLQRIMGRLEMIITSYGSHNDLWWGRFRHNWAVEYYGKWAERSYAAPAYPRFACGAGYVLSSNIIHWLAQNSHVLKVYQGEDTSMGIWMTAINPHYVDEPLWQCESNCISDMYATPDLTTEQLYNLWSNKEQCGDPCGCS